MVSVACSWQKIQWLHFLLKASYGGGYLNVLKCVMGGIGGIGILGGRVIIGGLNSCVTT